MPLQIGVIQPRISKRKRSKGVRFHEVCLRYGRLLASDIIWSLASVNDAHAGSLAQDAGTHLMDALSDVLRVVRLKGGVFLHAEFTAPWCIFSQIMGETLVGCWKVPSISCFITMWSRATRGRRFLIESPSR
jgi:hypothetical protein